MKPFINSVLCFLPSNSCAALFYAVRQFYAIAIFVMGRLATDGEAVELARKATPSLQTHSSGRSVSLDMTIFLPFYI